MTQTSPDELLKELNAALERDSRIDLSQWPVQTRFEEGTLVLEGTVVNIVARKAALATARQFSAGAAIIDRLRLVPAEHKQDEELQDEVIKTLLEESALNECTLELKSKDGVEMLREIADEPGGHIQIQVRDGVVTLAGHVLSLSHSRLAEVLTWWTRGCEAVVNQLDVVPAEQDTDDEVADAVHIVLEKDPVVPATQLTVTVNQGTVTLAGYVANHEEKKFALLDAWYVPGVWNVVDHIQTPG